MHLTNEQLLELTEEGREHLAQCDSCRIRAKNLSAIRAKLQNTAQKNLAQPKPMSDNWQQIKASYQNKNHQQQINSANKKVTFWRNMTVGMAASLVLFMAGQNYLLNSHQQDTFEQAVALAKAVESNSITQSLLVAQLESNPLNTSQVLSLQVELDIIDKKLQQAYLEKVTSKEKSALWQQRQAVIQSSIVTDSKAKIIKI